MADRQPELKGRPVQGRPAPAAKAPTGSLFTSRIGPLPVWLWLAVGAGALYLYRARKAQAAPGTAAPTYPPGMAGAVYADGLDPNAITDPYGFTPAGDTIGGGAGGGGGGSSSGPTGSVTIAPPSTASQGAWQTVVGVHGLGVNWPAPGPQTGTPGIERASGGTATWAQVAGAPYAAGGMAINPATGYAIAVA